MYDAVSLGNWYPTFRDNLMMSSWRFKKSKKGSNALPNIGNFGAEHYFCLLSVLEAFSIKRHESLRFVLIVLSSSLLNTHRSQNDGLCLPIGNILVPHFKHSLSPLTDTNGCEEWLMNGRKTLLLFIVEGNILAAILFFCRRLEDTSHDPGLRDVISPCHVNRRWEIHAWLVDRQTSGTSA